MQKKLASYEQEKALNSIFKNSNLDADSWREIFNFETPKEQAEAIKKYLDDIVDKDKAAAVENFKKKLNSAAGSKLP